MASPPVMGSTTAGTRIDLRTSPSRTSAVENGFVHCCSFRYAMAAGSFCGRASASATRASAAACRIAVPDSETDRLPEVTVSSGLDAVLARGQVWRDPATGQRVVTADATPRAADSIPGLALRNAPGGVTVTWLGPDRSVLRELAQRGRAKLATANPAWLGTVWPSTTLTRQVEIDSKRAAQFGSRAEVSELIELISSGIRTGELDSGEAVTVRLRASLENLDVVRTAVREGVFEQRGRAARDAMLRELRRSWGVPRREPEAS